MYDININNILNNTNILDNLLYRTKLFYLIQLLYFILFILMSFDINAKMTIIKRQIICIMIYNVFVIL